MYANPKHLHDHEIKVQVWVVPALHRPSTELSTHWHLTSR